MRPSGKAPRPPKRSPERRRNGAANEINPIQNLLAVLGEGVDWITIEFKGQAGVILNSTGNPKRGVTDSECVRESSGAGPENQENGRSVGSRHQRHPLSKFHR